MTDLETTQEIRTILLKYWDPLGVGDNPNLADECDDYISGILRLLDAQCTVDQLEQYLWKVEEKWELTSDPAASRAAKKIFDALQDSG
ncbi:MAG: hypothetical protein ACREC0_14735 [Methylocella sp.]